MSDDGSVKIASVDAAAGLEAKRRIEQITADVEVGSIYEGRVAKLMDFGAFVNILPGRDGLVHISQISEERVERVSDKLKEGDRVRVKVLEVDKQGPHTPEHEGGSPGVASRLSDRGGLAATFRSYGPGPAAPPGPSCSARNRGIRSSSQYRADHGAFPSTNPTCPPAALSSSRMAGASSARPGTMSRVMKGSSEGLKDQRRAGDFPQVLPAACHRVVMVGIAKPVQRRGDVAVKAVKAALAPHRVQVERPGAIFELAEDGATQVGDEVTPGYTREKPRSSRSATRASRKGTETARLPRRSPRPRAAFGQPLQQDIAPEGEAHHPEWCGSDADHAASRRRATRSPVSPEWYVRSRRLGSPLHPLKCITTARKPRLTSAPLEPAHVWTNGWTPGDRAG